MNELKIWELAEKWNDGTLQPDELQALKERLTSEPAFEAEFNECLMMLGSLNARKKNRRFRAQLQEIHRDHQERQAPLPKVIKLRTHFWRTAAVAASVAIIASLSTIIVLQNNPGRSVAIYQELRSIRNKQVEQDRRINKIQDSLNRKNGAPIAEVFSTGTAFAITSDGYLATSYHVIAGADSVYVRTRSGNYYKAYIAAYDQPSDLAVMKIENPEFRFSKNELPYTFAQTSAPLSSRIYTIGYPQESIVYNEGYVSGRNGFDGDTARYRLGLSASPGQSGSPVLDDRGNVIGILAAHERDQQDVSYAINIRSLSNLLDSTAVSFSLAKQNHMSRLSKAQQISRMEEFTCVVQVYKK